MVGAFTFRTEAISRGARMLRTALGPAIAAWLERSWRRRGDAQSRWPTMGRSSDRRADRYGRAAHVCRWRTRRPPRRASCWRGSARQLRACPRSYRKRVSDLKDCFRPWSQHPLSPSASLPLRSSPSTITSPPASCQPMRRVHCARRRKTTQCPGRRWDVNRQNHARQCVARRGR